MHSARRAFEPVVTRCRAEANKTKVWRGKASSWPSSMDAGLTALGSPRFLAGRIIVKQKEKLYTCSGKLSDVPSVLLVQRLV